MANQAGITTFLEWRPLFGPEYAPTPVTPPNLLKSHPLPRPASHSSDLCARQSATVGKFRAKLLTSFTNVMGDPGVEIIGGDNGHDSRHRESPPGNGIAIAKEQLQ